MKGLNIRLLDCTLRDGGHIVSGNFGEETIRNTIEKLVESEVDIIEVGFLWDKPCGKDIARYYNIEDIKKILPKNCGKTKFSVMADFIDLEHIEPCDGTIEFIRLSFKRWRLEWGLKTARLLMDKGYKVFINPVNNNVYTDKEYIEVLEKVNELHPYGFTIVDTFGVMRIKDLSHRYYLVENNLLPDIAIGVHLHENLGLAYSLAQHIVQISNPSRQIVIDGSLLGMGRVPGNLCIEQIMDFMNEQYEKQYALEPVYDVIDDYIAPIKLTNPWGYAIPYALSGKYNLHRTYAEYLINKKRLKTKDIQRILSQVDKKEAETFNEKYIEKLYLKYMNVEYDDLENRNKFKEELKKYCKFIIIAPGESIKDKEETIKNYIDEKTCVFSVNFNSQLLGINPDFIFLTNTKRYDAIKNNCSNSKLIISSNLIRDVVNSEYVFEYNSLAFFKDIYCDDSTLMLLNLLNRVDIRNIMLAGFDGEKNGVLRFCDKQLDRNQVKSTGGMLVKNILNSRFKDMKKTFITRSAYEEVV